MPREELVVPAHDSIPTPVRGIDPRAHAHTPLQRFVLGHVDGRRSIVDLSTATGVSASVIASLVKRLTTERVVRMVRPKRADERDSQRPTIPGEPPAELIAHERPTRPLPSSAPPPHYSVHGGPRSVRRRLKSVDLGEQGVGVEGFAQQGDALDLGARNGGDGHHGDVGEGGVLELPSSELVPVDDGEP
jgi:hypothetical protein